MFWELCPQTSPLLPLISPDPCIHVHDFSYLRPTTATLSPVYASLLRPRQIYTSLCNCVLTNPWTWSQRSLVNFSLQGFYFFISSFYFIFRFSPHYIHVQLFTQICSNDLFVLPANFIIFHCWYMTWWIFLFIISHVIFYVVIYRCIISIFIPCISQL